MFQFHVPSTPLPGLPRRSAPSPLIPVMVRGLLLALALLTMGCQTYSRATARRPHHASDTPAGQRIAETQAARSLTPEARIGGFLDAAALASEALQAHPDDVAARADYNFAVGRAVETVSRSNLEPWKAPIRCPGTDGDWFFTYNTSAHPDHDPARFSIRPADRYDFRGRLIRDRSLKDGLGAPLVVTSRGFDPTATDPFAQGRYIYYGMTAVVKFNGRQCRTALLDPLATEDVTFQDRTWPLAADFSAPIALALAELNPRRVEIQRMFRPEALQASTRLARLQPYDPSKIPVLFIHGLGDSHATWAPMIKELRSDETIRRHYQIWFFSYPTAYPYPMMAGLLRRQLDAIRAHYPDQKRMVVIGHSMGGMIARALITDSGLDLWKAYFSTPPEKSPLTPEARQMMEDALIFASRPEIARVIYLSASLRGSDFATGFVGRLGNRLIGEPPSLSEMGREALRLVLPPEQGQPITRMPNSVDALDPANRFVRVINELPTRKGVPYHSIMADRGRGGNKDRTRPVMSDGIVPYWSSHIPTARSELIVPANHWSHRHPAAIAEVRRILVEHLRPPAAP